MKSRNYQEEFKNKVFDKEEKRLKARSEGCEPFNWLGMLGMIGWSVSLPLVAGIALGAWIDKQIPSRFSFTMMLMLAGLAGGCVLAWYWVKQAVADFEKKDKICRK